MSGYVPVIGSYGLFDLLEPFNTDAVKGVQYHCRAVRSIADYVASNEDPKATIYKTHGIEAEYESDQTQNALIVSLQSDTGHWLHVPERYIKSYPSVNGVGYRSMAIAIHLPSLPVTSGLETLADDLADVVQGRLGVECRHRLVELSRVVQVTKDVHITKEAERNLRKDGRGTLLSQTVALQTENQLLRERLVALEAYILALLVP